MTTATELANDLVAMLLEAGLKRADEITSRIKGAAQKHAHMVTLHESVQVIVAVGGMELSTTASIVTKEHGRAGVVVAGNLVAARKLAVSTWATTLTMDKFEVVDAGQGVGPDTLIAWVVKCADPEAALRAKYERLEQLLERP